MPYFIYTDFSSFLDPKLVGPGSTLIHVGRWCIWPRMCEITYLKISTAISNSAGPLCIEIQLPTNQKRYLISNIDSLRTNIEDEHWT